jgi:16S rRNA G966 N2-methylase RsmD
MNRLLFGDNLPWLRNKEIFPDASVDLVYLDPPFNSNADYNVLFREAYGQASQEPDQMAIFIQLLRLRKTKSSNMLLVCSSFCYRLSR